MDFYAYFVLLFVVILFIVVLPSLSGVGTFKLDNSRNVKNAKQNGSRSDVLKFKLKKEEESSNADEISNGVSSSTISTSKKTGKFEIDSKTGLKKRVIGNNAKNGDPNIFDFDVDELINEDAEEEKRELTKRYSMFKGREYEAAESFV